MYDVPDVYESSCRASQLGLEPKSMWVFKCCIYSFCDIQQILSDITSLTGERCMKKAQTEMGSCMLCCVPFKFLSLPEVRWKVAEASESNWTVVVSKSLSSISMIVSFLYQSQKILKLYFYAKELMCLGWQFLTVLFFLLMLLLFKAEKFKMSSLLFATV